MKLTAVLLFAAACLPAQQRPQWATQGNISYLFTQVLIPIGMAGQPSPFRDGVTILLKTSDPKTELFRVTVQYSSSQGVASRSALVARSTSAQTSDSVYFELGDSFVISVFVEELSAHSAQEFFVH